MIEATSRKIIERYFLAQGESIAQIERSEEAVIVSTSRSRWRIESLERWPHFVKSEGYQLYDVRQSIVADPPPRPHGVTLLSDGSMFHLNEADQFRDFFGRVRTIIAPLELAGILSRYQGKGPGLEHHQNLIVRREDLTRLLSDGTIESLADFTLFQSTTNDGLSTLDFCTYFLAQEPPDYVFRVGVNRWYAAEGSGGGLEWSVRCIAVGLDSPRYSPTGGTHG